MESKPETRIIDALTARTHFGKIMEQAVSEQVRFLVNCRGKAKVVILSVEDYLRNIVKTPEVLGILQSNARKAGMDSISDAEIDAEIAAYRQSASEK